MHKTGCSGETRLVWHVPSSSWAGKRNYYYYYDTIIIIITVVVVVVVVTVNINILLLLLILLLLSLLLLLLLPLAPGPGEKADGCPSMAMSAVPASCCRPSSLCLINTWTQSTFWAHREHYKLTCVGVITCLVFQDTILHNLFRHPNQPYSSLFTSWAMLRRQPHSIRCVWPMLMTLKLSCQMAELICCLLYPPSGFQACCVMLLCLCLNSDSLI